jgi:anti-anti-sigma regulatory factor
MVTAVAPMSSRPGGGPISMAACFAVGPTVTRADIPVLCTGLAELLRGRAGGVVVCDVTGVARPDLVTIDALARLRMTARRHGWELVVSGAAPDLLRLLRLVGLAGVLPQAGGQPEQREQAGGVEEVVDGRDPPG